MTPKIRELIAALEQAGFLDRGGKGREGNFMHPKGVVLTLSGRPGDDAKAYQMKLVKEKLKEIQS